MSSISMLKRLGFARRKALKLFKHLYYYLFRFNWPVWYYLRNRQARLCWKRSDFKLSQVQKEIIRTLERDGVAMVPLAKLFAGGEIFQKIRDFAEEKLQSQSVLQRIAQQKKDLLEKGQEFQRYNPKIRLKKLEKESGSGSSRKDFFIPLFGSSESSVLDFSNPLIEMTLSDTVLGIVNGYLRMCGKFVYHNLNLTLPVPEGLPAYFSQRWHRDPDDIKLLKVFLYLNDIPTQRQGPFCYIAGSQLGGRWRHISPQSFPGGRYPKPGEVEEKVSAEDIKSCTAEAGTLIFCDTSGLHKGGYCLEGERLMFTGAFLSSASLIRGGPSSIIGGSANRSSLLNYALKSETAKD